LKENYNLSRSGPFPWVVERLTQSNELFVSLYKLWADTAAEIALNDGSLKNEKEYKKKFSSILNSLFGNVFNFLNPAIFGRMFDPVSHLLKNGSAGFSSIANDWSSFFTKFSAPILDRQKDSKSKFTDMFIGDDSGENYKEYTSSWYRSLQESIGKIINIPAMGPTREVQEKIQKAIDSFAKMEEAWNYFSAVLHKPWTESINKVSQKILDLSKKKIKVKSFKEIFNYWIEISVETFEKVFRSDGFTISLNLLMENTLDFWAKYQDILEEYFKYMPVPTKTDMNEVYKEIYLLKRKVKFQDKELKKLKGKL